MKKFVALFIVLIFAFSFVGCGEDALVASNTKETETVAETKVEQAIDYSKYPKTYEGLIKCLRDNELVPTDKNAVSAMRASILGAKKGNRYTVSSSVFVELYEYPVYKATDKLTDNQKQLLKTAKQVKDQITKNKGTFHVVEGLEELKGVYSKSGRFLLVYNPAISYDKYETIENIVKEF